MTEMFCQAGFNYVNPAIGETHEVSMPVRNGRQADLPGWETCGFELRQLPSAVSNWEDDDEIKRVHYPELVDLARQLTGCDFALVGSHIKRNPEQAALHADLGPIAFVHSDFAESYGDLMRQYYSDDSVEAKTALQLSGASVADVKRSKRLLILQFWRNLGPEKMDLPLAFCRADSVPASDLVRIPVTDYAGGGFDFDTLGIKQGNHDWYVFPEMTRDEAVVFRTYDSDRIGSELPFWTPHSAFRDPEVALGKPSRSSIELRATCIWT